MDKIKLLYNNMINARKLLILTGAGMSTACGIPDFRSPQGIWNGPDGARNQYLFSRQGFNRCQPDFFKAFKKMYNQFSDITSSGPYEYLRNLGDAGMNAAIATQNIDGLHRRFASANFEIFELHGTAATFPCEKCGRRYTAAQVLRLSDGVNVPKTPCCGCRFDTDIVLFGDQLPDSFEKLAENIRSFDYLLVMGSSLEVSPVNMLPRYFAKQHKAIINLQPTSADREFDIVIQENITEVLQKMTMLQQEGKTECRN